MYECAPLPQEQGFCLKTFGDVSWRYPCWLVLFSRKLEKSLLTNFTTWSTDQVAYFFRLVFLSSCPSSQKSLCLLASLLNAMGQEEWG